jgi:hypothetical protein
MAVQPATSERLRDLGARRPAYDQSAKCDEIVQLAEFSTSGSPAMARWDDVIEAMCEKAVICDVPEFW